MAGIRDLGGNANQVRLTHDRPMNFQGDEINCGFYVAFYAERLLNGFGPFNPNLNLAELRLRIIANLYAIANEVGDGAPQALDLVRHVLCFLYLFYNQAVRL